MTYGRLRRFFPVATPNWIALQLQRAGVSMETLLDLPALLKVCSLEDAAVLLNMNTDESLVNQVYGPGTFPGMGLAEYWGEHFPQELDKVIKVRELYLKVPEERLFLTPSEGASGEKPKVAFLDARSVRWAAIAIILKPGQLGGHTQREVQQSIVREYIRQLYVFTDFAQLAGDALFGRYLKSLAADPVPEPA